jgi:benzoyl-CoA reductase/2-hydroxyglutaryl-CoA dehydratase subunit BcrC/BadD/HgdB
MRAMRRALADPSRCALVNMFAPAELLHAMGLRPLCAEGFSSFLSGGKCERGYLDFASEKGVPETYCSYHRALLGAVHSGLLQKPRFIITSSSVCDANTSTFREAASHYGMEKFYIDVPHEESEEAVAYVRTQLERLVAFLEEGMGRRMDQDALRLAALRTNESVRYQRKFIDELARREFPNYISAEMHRIIVGHNLLGTEDALKFFRMQYEDIMEFPVQGGGTGLNVDGGIRDGLHVDGGGDDSGFNQRFPDSDPRAKRIIWCHVLPYYAVPLKKLFDFSDRYRLLISDLNFDQLTELDESDILGSMARRLIRNHFNGSALRRAESVTDMAKRLEADAAIIFCQWGCKHSNGGAFLLRDALVAAGVNTLVIDGDAVDRRGTNDGQLATRMQAFLEMLDGGR